MLVLYETPAGYSLFKVSGDVCMCNVLYGTFLNYKRSRASVKYEDWSFEL